jgi:ligand-binding sensor domain-containing protein
MTSFLNTQLTSDILINQDEVWICSTSGIKRTDLKGNLLNQFEDFNYQVNCLKKDKKGKIWIGTNDGVLTYFKGKWGSIKELKGKFISTIAIGNKGEVWLGTNSNGVFKLKRGKIENFNTKNSKLKSNSISCLFMDSSNLLWCGQMLVGLSTFDGKVWKEIEQIDKSSVWVTSIVEGQNKEIWIGTLINGVYQYKDENWQNFSNIPDGFSAYMVSDIIVDSQNTTWVATSSGLFFFDGLNWKKYNTSNSSLKTNHIKKLAFDGKNLWVGGASGFYLFENNHFKLLNLPSKNEINISRIVNATFDNAGNIWAVNQGMKLIKYNGNSFEYSAVDTTKEIECVKCPFVIDSLGNKWIGSQNTGLYKFENGIWKNYNTKNSGIIGDIIFGLDFDKSGALWVSTGYGESRFDGRNWINYTNTNSGLCTNFVNTVKFEENGKQWFATAKGISSYFNNTWTKYDISNAIIPDDSFRDMLIDRNGDKWFCSGKGVSKFDNVSWIKYDLTNSTIGKHEVTCMAIDKNGIKWFGTYNDGLFRFDGLEWKHFTTKDSRIASDDIRKILVDKNNVKWLFCGVGITKLED